MSSLDKELDEETHQLFWSLLGGLAWLLMTRADICPFIGYLQRAAQKPLNRHVRLINRVLRYCRRVPSGILFRRLTPPVTLVVVADAAYKANPGSQECLALRGYITMLVGADKTESLSPGGMCNVLDYVSKKFNTVTRSSFCRRIKKPIGSATSGSLLLCILAGKLDANFNSNDLSKAAI